MPLLSIVPVLLVGVLVALDSALLISAAKHMPVRALYKDFVCDRACMKKQTQLMTAVENDDLAAVQQLLDEGSAVDNSVTNRNRETPLHRAAYYGGYP